jgi:N-acyl-D-amino-acid deacylase
LAVVAAFVPIFGSPSGRLRRNVAAMRATCLGIVASLVLAATASRAATYDLILRGGRVVDGSGNPAYFADVAVKDGRIAAVGRITGDASSTIELEGLMVAPGFIDVHTHADEIDELPLAENYARMGVTTIIAGNCGHSVLDIAEFFQRLDAAPASVNVATLVGHGTIRSHVMEGSFNRPPTLPELERMKGLVDRAMTDGAVGLSTGLIYLPGVFAQTDEIVELAKIAAAHDGIYASHMRDEGSRIQEALAELFEVARSARIRTQISHLKLAGKANWGHPEAVLAAIERARAEGLDVTQDQYLYTASSTGLSQLVPETAREGGRLAERLTDPKAKAAIVAEMKAKLRRGKRRDYSYVMIADCESDPSLNGLNLVEAARRQRGSASLQQQIELILEIQKAGGATAVFHGINESDLQQFLRHPHTMIAADSGLRRFGEGVPHPRGYGNNARALARYVRELGLLRLEDAVRRMTSLPANTFRLRDRGSLRVGNWADLVVFNPATVQDRATFHDPHHYATGFAHVFVNGIAVVRNDTHTGARPGMSLRHAPATDRPAAGAEPAR